MQARQLAAAAACLLGGALLPALASQKSDQQFLRNAIETNYAEIQMGKLAEQKGQTEDVKSFGRILATDHEQANTKAIKLAEQLGIQAPTGPDKRQEKEYQTLEQKSGKQFHTVFVKEEVKDHKKAIHHFKKEAKGNDQVAQYAQETLPVLNKHEEMARAIQSGKGIAGAATRGNAGGGNAGAGAGAEQGTATP